MHVVIINHNAMKLFKAMTFNAGLIALWNHLLTLNGQPTLEDSTEPIKPSAYGIPEKQTKELLDAWQKADPEGAATMVMTWCNVGPSSVRV